MESPFVVLSLLVFVYTGAALLMDVRQRRIPNWLTATSLAVALLFHAVIGGWQGLGHALGGFAVGFGFVFVLWLIGGAGGGDVKLLGALGAWLGASTTLTVLMLTTPLALVLAVGAIITRSMRSQSRHQTRLLARQGVPYAVPVAVSSWSILILKLVSPQ